MLSCALIFGLIFISASNAANNSFLYRVVNGKNADICAYPFVVSLRNEKEKHFCGGAIVGDKWILTAAHCFDIPLKTHVVVGSTKQDEKSGDRYKIKKVYLHPKYVANTQPIIDDIALIELDDKIEYTSCVESIKIDDKLVPIGAQVEYAGWGATKTGGRTAYLLQEISMITIGNFLCSLYYSDPVGRGVLCASATVRNGGVCNGDSGGPLLYNGKVIGVTSYGHTDCGITAPDAFTRVSHYAGWINDVIKKNN